MKVVELHFVKIICLLLKCHFGSNLGTCQKNAETAKGLSKVLRYLDDLVITRLPGFVSFLKAVQVGFPEGIANCIASVAEPFLDEDRGVWRCLDLVGCLLNLK